MADEDLSSGLKTLVVDEKKDSQDSRLNSQAGEEASFLGMLLGYRKDFNCCWESLFTSMASNANTVDVLLDL
ncbi:hypothetical protein J6590_018268 [Homalodisca vitripennis]|nr:hypothetical protein J6590_018268 [Homalodisca vitripennis]